MNKSNKEVGMNLTRRGFLKVVGVAGASTAIRPSSAHAASTADLQNTFGCLVDTTLCVGCRKCEQACNAAQQSSEAARSPSTR